MRRTNPIAGREREPRRAPTIVDIIDRILDRGIVIEYHARISVAGIDTLATVDARYIVSSFNTYLHYAEPLRSAGLLPSTLFAELMDGGGAHVAATRTRSPRIRDGG